MRTRENGGWVGGLLLRQIAADKEGLAFGVEEHAERPAAIMAHQVGRDLIELVQTGILQPVDDDGDEILVEDRLAVSGSEKLSRFITWHQ